MAYYERDKIDPEFTPAKRFHELTGVDPTKDPFAVFVLDPEKDIDVSWFDPSRPFGTFVGHPARVPCFAQHMFKFSIGVKGDDEDVFSYTYEIQKKVLTYVLDKEDPKANFQYLRSRPITLGPYRDPGVPGMRCVLVVPCCEITDPRGHRWTRMYSFEDAVKEVVAIVVSEYPTSVFQYTIKYMGGMQFQSPGFVAEDLSQQNVVFPRIDVMETCHMSSVLNSIVMSSPPEAPLTPPSPRAVTSEERIFFTVTFMKASPESWFIAPRHMRFEKITVPVIEGCHPHEHAVFDLGKGMEGVEIGKGVIVPVSLRELIPVLADHMCLVMGVDDSQLPALGFASLDAQCNGEVRKLGLVCAKTLDTREKVQKQLFQAFYDAERIMKNEKKFACLRTQLNLAQ